MVTTSPERCRQVAEDLGRPVFASLADLASAGAEAVAISTPAGTHVTLTEQALRLGLAVVCDKPFAPDADSARQVVRLSEQLNVPLTVYQSRRWDSDFLTVPSARGAWHLFYPAFAAAVRGTQPMPVNPWDAVATAAVLDAARASAHRSDRKSRSGHLTCRGIVRPGLIRPPGPDLRGAGIHGTAIRIPRRSPDHL